MRSLRAREFAAIALAVVASVGVTLVLAVVLVRSSAQHEALNSLARQAALIAAQQQAARTSGATGLSNLGVFFDTQQERARSSRSRRPRSCFPRRRSGAPCRTAQRRARSSSAAALPLRRPPGGARAVVLLSSARLEASDLHPFTIAFGIAAAVGAAIAAVAAFLLARAVSRPIERVSEASLALAAGERPGPLPETGSTEVAALAESFNQMADDLDRAKAAERSFLLSVSHELKTPLAAIRGHGEAILDGVMTIEQAAPVVVQESKRLERLVRDLLDLARLNQRSFSVQLGRSTSPGSRPTRSADTGPSRCASGSRSTRRRTVRRRPWPTPTAPCRCSRT